MSVPVNIRANVRTPFPAVITCNSPMSVAKANGVWTFNVDLDGLVLQIIQGLGGIPPNYRATTSAPVSVLSSPPDYYIGVDTNAIGAAWSINLVTAVSRKGLPLYVKDIGGKAHTFPGTFVPAAGDLIDNTAGSPTLMNIDRQIVGLLPVTQGTGAPGWIRVG